MMESVTNQTLTAYVTNKVLTVTEIANVSCIAIIYSKAAIARTPANLTFAIVPKITKNVTSLCVVTVVNP